jgi:selenocysteine lyase/cysteine desulfurase
MRRLDGRKGVHIFTSFDAAMAGAIGNVGLEGIAPDALAEHLWQRRRIIVTPIVHEEFKGIRVTPNVYTTLGEVDAFVEEMERVVERGLVA